MRRPMPLRPAVLATLALACGRAAAEPLTYLLDPQASFVHFELSHFATSTLRGRIGPVDGFVVLDRAARSGLASLSVATASVSTGAPAFDARLRQSDLLASDSHPQAWFVASQFRYEGDAVAEVRGEFTWRGVSRPLSLKALHYACHDGDAAAATSEVCGGSFEGELLRSDFGATFGLPFVADRVRLVVEVEGRRR